jgi:hypothetical protein
MFKKSQNYLAISNRMATPKRMTVRSMTTNAITNASVSGFIAIVFENNQ